jgi:hypothetical protein
VGKPDKPAAAPKPIKPAAPKPTALTKAPSAAAEVAKPQPRAQTLARAKTPPPPARTKTTPRPTTKPATPAAVPKQTDSFLNLKTVGGGLALLGLVGVGAYAMMRRRSSSESADEDFGDDPLSDDNPFADLGDSDASTAMGLDQSGKDEPEFGDFGAGASDDSPIPKSAAASPQEDLFDTNKPGDAPDQAAGDDMDTFGNTTVASGIDTGAPMMGVGAGDGSEVMRMLQELGQKVATLESRLDQVTEAKDRLERQVEAQTEELRVQRAAIARTQRALRNLNRPEEEAPTEPTLRDPNR